MMQISALRVLLLLLLAGAPILAGCEREGPMEEAGEAIDDAVDDAKD